MIALCRGIDWLAPVNDGPRRGLNAPFYFLRVALLVLGSLHSQILPAQEAIAQMVHRRWTAQEGAPAAIKALAQAHDGTLWIATEGGLFNFDGLTFRPFAPPAGEPALASTGVESVLVARDGALWVGLWREGVARITKDHVKLYPAADGKPLYNVQRLRQGPDGSIWALENLRRLIRLGADDAWHYAPLPAPDPHIHSFFIDSKNILWIAQDKRLYQRDLAQNGPYTVTTTAVDYLFGAQEAPDGTLWLSDVVTAIDRGRTQHIDRSGHLIEAFDDDEEAPALLFAPDGALWLGSFSAGIRRAQIAGAVATTPSRIKPRIDSYDHRSGLSADSIEALLLDMESNIWVGTPGGLDRFSRPKIKPFLSKNNAGSWAVCANPQGEVWIASPSTELHRLKDGVDSSFAKDESVYYIHCSANGDSWFIDQSGIFRVVADKIERFPTPAWAAPYGLEPLIERQDGSLFAAAGDATGYSTYRDGKWIRTPGTPGAARRGLNVAFVDSHGTVYFGFASGQVGNYTDNVVNVRETGNPGLGTVTGFLESSYGIMAAGVNGVALLRGIQFEMLKFADGSKARGITGITDSPDGDVWLNGARGITHIPAVEMQTAKRDPAHMLQVDLVDDGTYTGPAPLHPRTPSAARDSQGTLWFATANGVVSLDPAAIKIHEALPLLSINSIRADNRALSEHNTFPPKPDTLRVQYFGVHLTAPEHVMYRYKLEGLDQSWQDAAHGTEATYTHLGPGQYTFQVMASNGDGSWTQPVSSPTFVVLPSFYQTWWFKLFCVGLAGALVWLLLSMRLRQMSRAIRARAEERADERIRIARDLHDTLLQGIQGLMLRFHVAAQQVPNGADARAQLDVALTTADQILVEARDRVSRLRSPNLVTELAGAYEKIAADLDYEKRVAFSVSVIGKSRDLVPAVREELYFIGREAITNSFRHAEASEISVSIDYTASALQISFKDNGCGFHPAQKSHDNPGHWGLLGMLERAHRIGATFHCRSAPGEGTDVVVQLSALRAYLRYGLISRLLT